MWEQFQGIMAVSFFVRTTAKTGTLFARLRSRVKNIDIKASMLLEVDVVLWNKAQSNPTKLKNLRNASPEMYAKIDEVEKTLNSILESETEITTELVNKVIYSIVYAEQIEKEKRRVKEEMVLLEQKKAKTFGEFVEQYISECESGLRKKKGGTTNVASGTIKSYRGFLSQLRAYEKAHFILVGFSDITLDFYNSFRLFLTDKEYSPNTIARMVKICKTMCYAAEQLKLMEAGNVRAGFEVIYKDVDNVYLTEERIEELYRLNLSHRPAWEHARDVFVVGCLTGQRVSDYKRINKEMIVTLPDGFRYIKLKQAKTGNTVLIPLDERVATILDKYDGTLPKIQDQKINDYIKKIGEFLGWVENVSVKEQRGAMTYKDKKRFCDMLKTHTCRRTLATNMQKSGASLANIMAITGHGSEQQLKTYLKLRDEERAMLAIKEDYFTKMKIVK